MFAASRCAIPPFRRQQFRTRNDLHCVIGRKQRLRRRSFYWRTSSSGDRRHFGDGPCRALFISSPVTLIFRIALFCRHAVSPVIAVDPSTAFRFHALCNSHHATTPVLTQRANNLSRSHRVARSRRRVAPQS